MPLITTTSDIPGEIQGYYDRNLLENSTRILIYDKFGQIRPLPKNMGTRIEFKRFGKLPINTTRLPEGKTPTGKKLSAITIYATMAPYGDFITVSDWVLMTGLDANLLSIGKDLLSDQMAETADILTRNVLLTGTQVRYAAGVVTTRATVNSAIVDADIDQIVRTLENSRAKKITEMFAPDSRTNTVPIRPSYIGVTHMDARYDLEHLTKFTSPENYPRQDALSKYEGELIELGECRGIRFLATDHCKIWQAGGAAVAATGLVADDSTNIDVYGTLIFGRNAYGVIPLQKGNVKNIVKALGSAGTEDPLNQRATSGWKMAKTAKILNEDWMIRLEHGCTALT